MTTVVVFIFLKGLVIIIVFFLFVFFSILNYMPRGQWSYTSVKLNCSERFFRSAFLVFFLFFFNILKNETVPKSH